jgi:hypothetical protein
MIARTDYDSRVQESIQHRMIAEVVNEYRPRL